LNADWFRTVVHQVANRGEVIALDTPTHAAHFDIGDRAQRGTCAICKPATANVISERAAAYWRDLAKAADQNRPGTEVGSAGHATRAAGGRAGRDRGRKSRWLVMLC
jgi:hypothetical protein